MTIYHWLRNASVAALLTVAAFGANAQTRSLILGDWYGGDATLEGIRTDLIGADARFDQANSSSFNLNGHGLPTLSLLQSFNSVLVFTDSISVDMTSLSNLLGNYVDTGGRVVLSTFWGQEAGNAGGIINGTGYNPLINPQSNAYSSASLGAYNAADPLMQGVTSIFASTYRGDYVAGVDVGATVAAFWDDGTPLAAYNATHSVYAITLNPNVVGLGHASGDYGVLFANALAVANPVPEPETYAMMLAGLGLLALARRRRTKTSA